MLHMCNINTDKWPVFTPAREQARRGSGHALTVLHASCTLYSVNNMTIYKP